MVTLWSRRAACGLLVLTLAACEKPVVVDQGTPAVANKVEYSVAPYEVRYLELTEGGQTYEYKSPVLILPVTIKNNGDKPLTYSPNHTATTALEASTPLLYADPGPEAALPPETKQSIKSIILKKGSLKGQIQSTKAIAPGESLTDLFLFEVPPKALTSLILSLPPILHGGKAPALVRIPYTAKAPVGPKVYAQGDTIDMGGVTFTVTGTEIAYIKIDDTTQGKGFSTNPLFKINYTIANTGEGEVDYDPGHNALGTLGARLSSPSETFKRMRFPATTTAEGQLKEQDIPAGGKVSDYLLFEVPDKDATEVTLSFPASTFQREGIARVTLPFEFKEVPKPAELKPK